MADAALPLCPKLYTLFDQPCFCERVYILLHLREHVCVELSAYGFDKLSVVSRVAVKSLSLYFLLRCLSRFALLSSIAMCTGTIISPGFNLI